MPHSGKSLLGALSAPVYWLYRLWCRSLRYTEINRAAIENTTDQGRPVVLSLWHDELFPLIYLKRKSKHYPLRKYLHTFQQQNRIIQGYPINLLYTHYILMGEQRVLMKLSV